MEAPLRVLIVDDHAMVRHGLRSLPPSLQISGLWEKQQMGRQYCAPPQNLCRMSTGTTSKCST